MSAYTAEVISLNGTPTIRIKDGWRLVGYFTDLDQISDHGLALSPADLTIKETP